MKRTEKGGKEKILLLYDPISIQILLNLFAASIEGLLRSVRMKEAEKRNERKDGRGREKRDILPQYYPVLNA